MTKKTNAVGSLKNKQQLINALQKTTSEELMFQWLRKKAKSILSGTR